jgi:hypothetical protein
MGLLDRFRNRPPSRDEFAQMLLKRIRASGDARPITYDPDAFRFVKSADYVCFLGNTYQEFVRTTATEREETIRRFLTLWHTMELPAPEEFNDVKADMMPALRARSYLEIDVQLASDKETPPPPYEIIGEHLALSLVYDLPTSMMTVGDELLEKWGVSFYEAMEVAKQNLYEKPTQVAQIGSAYSLVNADGYDATRMVSLDLIRQLKVEGEVIAMAPNRERLYIAGSEDADGLAFMLHFAKEDLQHERYITGIVFRLEDDEWQPWLPPPEHPLYGPIRKLRTESIGQMYTDQANLLNMRHEKTGIDIWVASFSGLEDKSTGDVTSYCIWADGVDSLLPETDEVFLVRRENEEVTTLARGDWEKVRQCAGDLMEPQGTYPERWRVRQFPDAATLAQIGTK